MTIKPSDMRIATQYGLFGDKQISQMLVPDKPKHDDKISFYPYMCEAVKRYTDKKEESDETDN
jgi:hypothetical protein